MIAYYETDLGCALLECKDMESGIRKAYREAGTIVGIKNFRKATKADIAWIRAMRGWVPEKALKRLGGK